MPASMTMALVASRPKVMGSRIEMPASGPMPGSTPTRVPPRQPMNAKSSTSGRRATEKPSARLSRVDSTGRLEPQDAARQRRLEERVEDQIGEAGHADAEKGRIDERLALDPVGEAEQQQRHGR